MGEPFAARRAGCGGAALGAGPVSACGGEVRWVGVMYYPYPEPRLFRAFACADHRHQLDVARPLDAAGRAQLAERRARHRRVVDDAEPYVPEAPLAVGGRARVRLEAARRYARGRPGWWIAE